MERDAWMNQDLLSSLSSEPKKKNEKIEITEKQYPAGLNQKSSSVAPAPSLGSSWNAKRIQRAYEYVRESGKSIQEVAIERFGSFEAFKALEDSVKGSSKSATSSQHFQRPRLDNQERHAQSQSKDYNNEKYHESDRKRNHRDSETYRNNKRRYEAIERFENKTETLGNNLLTKEPSRLETRESAEMISQSGAAPLAANQFAAQALRAKLSHEVESGKQDSTEMSSQSGAAPLAANQLAAQALRAKLSGKTALHSQLSSQLSTLRTTSNISNPQHRSCRNCHLDSKLILYSNEHVTVTLPQTSSFDTWHCFISPKEHASSSVSLSKASYHQLMQFMTNLCESLADQNRTCIFVERSFSSIQHCQWECFSVKQSQLEDAKMVWRQSLSSQDDDWRTHTALLSVQQRPLYQVISGHVEYLAVLFGSVKEGVIHIVEEESSFNEYWTRRVMGAIIGKDETEWRMKRDEMTTEKIRKVWQTSIINDKF